MDGIPHVAFISAQGDLALTLVGDIPKSLLAEQTDKMVAVRYDIFVTHINQRAQPCSDESMCIWFL